MDAFTATTGWSQQDNAQGQTIISTCGRIRIGHRTQHRDGSAVRVEAKAVPGGRERWRVTATGHLPLEVLDRIITVTAHELVRDPDALLYRVGPGSGSVHLEIDAEQWRGHLDPKGTQDGFASKDGWAVIAWAPASRLQGPDIALCTMSAGTDLDAPLWQVTVSTQIPHHLFERILDSVLDSAPVRRSTAHAVDLALAPFLRITPAPARTAPPADPGSGTAGPQASRAQAAEGRGRTARNKRVRPSARPAGPVGPEDPAPGRGR